MKEPSPAMLDQARAPEQPDFNAASTSPSNGVQTSAPNPAPPTQPAGPPPRAQISRQGNPAVVALLNNASGHVDGGEWDRAAADLERALRIEPRNATIWHDLAQVRLQQRQYQLAESLASKSNSMAGENKNVRARNWRLIANARRLSGNSSGADAAEAQAVVLER